MTAISISMSSAPNSTQTIAQVRHHKVVIDRPESKGGSDGGPMGGELLLASLGGCFSSTLLAAAAARDIELGEVSIKVTGQIEAAPARFGKIDVAVSSTECETTAFEHLIEVAHRGCLVATTLGRGVTTSIRSAKLEHG